MISSRIPLLFSVSQSLLLYKGTTTFFLGLMPDGTSFPHERIFILVDDQLGEARSQLALSETQLCAAAVERPHHEDVTRNSLLYK